MRKHNNKKTPEHNVELTKPYWGINFEALSLGIDDGLPDLNARLKKYVAAQRLENITLKVGEHLNNGFLRFMEDHPEHKEKILK